MAFDTFDYAQALSNLNNRYQQLVSRKNQVDANWYNGVYERYVDPVLTRDHAPVSWKYDLNPKTNPMLLERLGINATLNSGAIIRDGKVQLVVRVEGNDRKSFFAIAESATGVDGFEFKKDPILLPQTDRDDVNVYDMRLTEHEDGYFYGLFCTERKDPEAPEGDTSMAEAQCGIVRTKDLINWERLPDLKSPSPQQRNVVLHPEFVNGEYAFYTRPQDGFISTGKGGGIGWGTCKDMANPVIDHETIVHAKTYHTIYEVKNGQGPQPFKTDKGWLHLAHGVRNCASGLRYVLYMMMTDLNEPWKVTHLPSGHFIAPLSSERVGDVSNVTFSNGWVKRDNGEVLIYYASSDTRMHVATSTLDRLVDYTINTPQDPFKSHLCVQQRLDLINANRSL
ncbi:MAG: glycosidase [Phycisphaeraceae bacterium JB051]